MATQRTVERMPATLIPGDGIGPEIVEAVVEIIDVLGAPFAWDRQEAGMAGIAAAGDPLPPATLESIRRTGPALKGPLATPVGGGHRSVNVRLREDGVRTRDLGGQASTRELAEAVVSRLR